MSDSTEINSFQDLEDLDGHEVQEIRSGFERELGSIEGERRDLRSERMDLVNRVRTLRDVVGQMEGAMIVDTSLKTVGAPPLLFSERFA